MARAKRTDRASARRRHRAQVAADAAAEDEQTVGIDGAEPGEEERDAPRRVRREPAQPAPSSKTPERLGFVAAVRAAYQVADVRADLRALPGLLRSRALVIPVALSAVSLLAGFMSVATTDAMVRTVAGLAVALFLGPLPIGSIYVAAVLTPRAAYLMGAIASLIGTLGLLALLGVATTPLQGSSVSEVVVIAVEYTIFGGVIGAGLGFYRRLLKNMNPGGSRSQSRGRPPSKGASRPAAAKPAARR